MLPNFRIQTRLYAGFAMVVAVGLGLAIYGTLLLTGLGSQVDRLGLITTNLTRAAEVTQRLQAIRASEIQMRLNGDHTAFDDAKTQIAGSVQLMTSAAHTSVSDERRVTYNAFKDALDIHAGTLARYADMQHIQTEAQEKLFAGGGPLTAASTRLMTDASAAHHEMATGINTAILLTRIANWRFQNTSDPADRDIFNDLEAKAQVAVAALDRVASPTEKGLLAPVLAALERYRVAFAGFSAARLQSLDVYDHALQPQMADMVASLRTVSEAQVAAFTTIKVSVLQTLARSTFMQEVVAALSLLLGVSIAFVIARSIVGPLKTITAAMTRLAGGNSMADIPGRGNTDEVGEMARAVEVFRQQAIENMRLGRAAEREQASKNQRQAAMDSHIQDFGTSISGVMTSLGEAAEAIRSSSAVMHQGAQQTRQTTSATFDGAEASTRDLTAVAVAAEQLSSSVREISRQVSNVTSSVQTAVARASETDQKVAALSQAADRIGAVVSLITRVASQTNLLALNATIEAARAGEAGRGFAVVANEVKALAAQTAKATDEISSQVVAIREATSDAVLAVRDVGKAISQVEEVAGAIAAAVEEQAVATQEITASMQKVTETTTAATSAMGEVLAIAETTGTSSSLVLKAAEDVGRTSTTLRREVSDFLVAMSSGDDNDKRKYERISAGNVMVPIRFSTGTTSNVPLSDISLGGAGLIYIGQETEGAELEVTLPGQETVHARIARIAKSSIGVSFRQGCRNPRRGQTGAGGNPRQPDKSRSVEASERLKAFGRGGVQASERTPPPPSNGSHRRARD